MDSSNGFKVPESRMPICSPRLVPRKGPPPTPTPQTPEVSVEKQRIYTRRGTNSSQIRGISDPGVSLSKGVSENLASKGSVGFDYFPKGLSSNGVLAYFPSKGFGDTNSRFSNLGEASTSNGRTGCFASKGSVDQSTLSNGLSASFPSKGFVHPNTTANYSIEGLYNYAQVVSTSNGVSASLAPKGFVDQSTMSNGVSASLVSNGVVDQSPISLDQAMYNALLASFASKAPVDKSSRFNYSSEACNALSASISSKGCVDQSMFMFNHIATSAKANANAGSNCTLLNLAASGVVSASTTQSGSYNGGHNPLFPMINGNNQQFHTAVSASVIQNGNNNVVNNPLLSILYSQNHKNQQHDRSDTMLLANPSSNDREVQKPCDEFCALNDPDKATDDALSKQTISCQFAPVTPDHRKKLENESSALAPITEEGDKCCQDKTLSEQMVDSDSLGTPTRESCNLGRREILEIDLNLTPEQKSEPKLEPKPGKKKHRPKVVREGQPKRTPKTVSVASKQASSAVKRKYVRKKVVKDSNTPVALAPAPAVETQVTEIPAQVTGIPAQVTKTPAQVTEIPMVKKQYVRRKGTKASNTPITKEAMEINNPSSNAKRTLNFVSLESHSSEESVIITPNHEERHKLRSPNHQDGPTSPLQNFDLEIRSSERSSAITHTQEGMVPENKLAVVAFDLNCSSNQILGDYPSFPESSSPTAPPPPTEKKLQKEGSFIDRKEIFSLDGRKYPMGENSKIHLQSTVDNFFLVNDLILPFPKNCKRKRSQYCRYNAQNVLATLVSLKAHKRQRCSENILTFGESCLKKKERSKLPIRARDVASLTEAALYKQFRIQSLLCAEIPKKPRSLAISVSYSRHIQVYRKRYRAPSNYHPVNSVSYSGQNQVYLIGYGDASNEPVYPVSYSGGNDLYFLDDYEAPFDDYLQFLDSTEDGKNTIEAHEYNALVPFLKDSRIAPYDRLFVPIKPQKPRGKVNLDPETDRVWKLLMEKDGSEGAEETSPDKEKWWNEERKVFSGRADSFIARMHLVQGDRRYLQWKGSVVDSVVGVFLTQNVTDHFSSSAFMSLASRFPIQSSNDHSTWYQVQPDMLIEEPEGDIPDSDDTVILSSNVSVESAYDQGTITCLEATNVAESRVDTNTELTQSDMRGRASLYNSNEKNLTAYYTRGRIGKTKFAETDDREALEDVFPQNSAVSSIKSDSALHSVETIRSCSNSDLETQDLSPGNKSSNSDGSTSFVKLLNMDSATLLQEYYNGEDERLKPNVDTKNMNVKVRQLKNGKTRMDNIASLEERFACLSLEQVAHIPSDKYHSKMSPSSQEPDVDVQEVSGEGTGLKEVQNQSYLPKFSSDTLDVGEGISSASKKRRVDNKNIEIDLNKTAHYDDKAFDETNDSIPKANGKIGKEKKEPVDWDNLRKEVLQKGNRRERTIKTQDSVDWDAVRCADVNEVADSIKERGMNNVLARRIKDFLNRLVRDHGSIDLEWLRDTNPDKVKDFLLSIRGLGLKSVECVRLLSLNLHAFPVDTNVARIAVRLGWVPLQPLPEDLQIHLLELYPMLDTVQKYLWPRLCTLDRKTLYELHYQMITFGKVFCTKRAPNCNSCPMRADCRHFASAFASAKLALPGPEEKGLVPSAVPNAAESNPVIRPIPMSLPFPEENLLMKRRSTDNQQESIIEEPIIEEPSSPEPIHSEMTVPDIEDALDEDPDEIPTIKLNLEEFALNLQNYVQESGLQLQEGDLSKALVALTPDSASIPLPKLKTVTRLRTEHQVYIIPDEHPLLKKFQLERRDPDDPNPYLLSMWAPGEIAESMQPPERCGGSRELGDSCNKTTCSSCNGVQEENCQVVRGTLLIPSKTAMRGSFPLNGTYFQVNEMFADHESSLNPINVPRDWLWNLEKRTVFFGTSVTAIFRGMPMEAIQTCFWRGYVCVRGFDQKSRAPRPLGKRFHISPHKLDKTTNGRNEM